VVISSTSALRQQADLRYGFSQYNQFACTEGWDSQIVITISKRLEQPLLRISSRFHFPIRNNILNSQVQLNEQCDGSKIVSSTHVSTSGQDEGLQRIILEGEMAGTVDLHRFPLSRLSFREYIQEMDD
jgi:hypothetical protein